MERNIFFTLRNILALGVGLAWSVNSPSLGSYTSIWTPWLPGLMLILFAFVLVLHAQKNEAPKEGDLPNTHLRNIIYLCILLVLAFTTTLSAWWVALPAAAHLVADWFEGKDVKLNSPTTEKS